jgi:hypothetical protein
MQPADDGLQDRPPRPADPMVVTPAGSGYRGAAYARSLGHLGRPASLGASGGWCLLRPIEGTPWEDATGPYPFLSCADWPALADDIPRLADRAVSFVFVTDPLAEVPLDRLARACPDLCRPYKVHHVLDLAPGEPGIRSAHHRRNVRLGLLRNSVEIAPGPAAWLADWIGLYDGLIARHGIDGPARFSVASFRCQFEIPGLIGVRATSGGETTGMTLWLVMGECAYYHLGAVSPRGRDSLAMFAMFSAVIDHLAAAGIRRLCLGAGAGVHGASDGLERFKRGWANGTASVMLCGRILDGIAYEDACRLRGRDPRFFPSYRSG